MILFSVSYKIILVLFIINKKSLNLFLFLSIFFPSSKSMSSSVLFCSLIVKFTVKVAKLNKQFLKIKAFFFFFFFCLTDGGQRPY